MSSPELDSLEKQIQDLSNEYRTRSDEHSKKIAYLRECLEDLSKSIKQNNLTNGDLCTVEWKHGKARGYVDGIKEERIFDDWEKIYKTKKIITIIEI
jgi:hypothetical protein